MVLSTKFEDQLFCSDSRFKDFPLSKERKCSKCTERPQTELKQSEMKSVLHMCPEPHIFNLFAPRRAFSQTFPIFYELPIEFHVKISKRHAILPLPRKAYLAMVTKFLITFGWDSDEKCKSSVLKFPASTWSCVKINFGSPQSNSPYPLFTNMFIIKKFWLRTDEDSEVALWYFWCPRVPC